MPDSIIQKVTAWAWKFQKEIPKNKIEFLNRHRERFAWDNDDLDDADEGWVGGDVPHPDLAAEIPGVTVAVHQPAPKLRDEGALQVPVPDEQAEIQRAVQNDTLLHPDPAPSPGVPAAECTGSQECRGGSTEGSQVCDGPKVEVSPTIE